MMEKTINDVKTGDIVTLHGTKWLVMGYVDRPAVILERVGCECTPVNQRTHHVVVLGSEHAKEFKLKHSDMEEAAVIADQWRDDGCTVADIVLLAIKRGRELEREGK